MTGSHEKRRSRRRIAFSSPTGFGSATLSASQIQVRDALLALRVNGADLSPDHGYPARIVVPALPGVHNTKWVSRLTFLSTHSRQP